MSPVSATNSSPPSPDRISVIIASELDQVYVRRCLTSLLEQARRFQAEVLVTYWPAQLDAKTLQQQFPEVRFIEVASGNSIPKLRYAGTTVAQGEILAMTEASAVFTPTWMEEMIRGLENGADAAGGPIDPDPDFDLKNWAAHLCEYGAYMSPVTPGPGKDFSGFNACYRRSLFEQCRDSIHHSHWETVLHEEARRAGGRLFLLNTMRLLNTRRYRAGEFLRQRFIYGRDYGRIRAGRISRAMHLALVMLTPGLPFLMLFRYARWIVSKGLPLGRAVLSFPLLALFATAWSAGEWLGYLQALRVKGASLLRDDR